MVINQDTGMRSVIRCVFPNTRHMFCMWHIMTKVPKEVIVFVLFHVHMTTIIVTFL